VLLQPSFWQTKSYSFISLILKPPHKKHGTIKIMIDSLIKLLGVALSIWDSKEKTKYFDKWMNLKREYYAELGKPRDDRDNAVMDNILFELQLLVDAFSSKLATKNT